MGEKPGEQELQPEQTAEQRVESILQALPAETAEKIRNRGRLLEETLGTYMLRPNSDPKVLDLFYELIGEFSNSSRRGTFEDGLTPQKTDELKGGLIGATKIFTAEEQINSDLESKNPKDASERARLAGIFLKLTNEKVGTYDSETGETEIKMKIRENQSRGTTVKRTQK